FALPDRETTLSIVGLSLDVAMARLLPGADEAGVQRLSEGYKAEYLRLRRAGAEGETPFFEGARETLERLDRAGWLLGVATGKARRGLDHLLASHGLERLFVATQTADDAPSKPHPGMVQNVLAATGVEAARAVMIGDTAWDIGMGRAAGVRTVGVSWGYHPVPSLTGAGADHVVDRFDALEAALDALAPA
ncbi:MAG: HAD-IA family hydrolase, partial [Pseudomonadota bacterium]